MKEHYHSSHEIWHRMTFLSKSSQNEENVRIVLRLIKYNDNRLWISIHQRTKKQKEKKYE